MKTTQPNDFVAASRKALQDPILGASVANATNTAAYKRQLAMFVYGREHAETMRQQAAEAKRRALSRLPELLELAEKNMQANGIHVLWASNSVEVCDHVVRIARQHNIKRITKSKSMVSEEVYLNHALEAQGIDVLETDLGEYIIQLAGESPSHIVTPVIHKSKEMIRDLFVDQLGMIPTDDAAEMTRFARHHLRRSFLEAEMGVSGGNFVIAETGTLCLVTNEGNGRMVTSLPPVHVAIVGIEKIVETLDDYVTLTQVLPRSATGQVMSVYTHMINGPRQSAEEGGPSHLYVILADNGRSGIYNSSYVQTLTCLRCGACINVCPVYEAVGGHAYGWVYPGPIGSVITPLLKGIENASPLPYASSLCGACKEVCPVGIDLPKLLLDLRYQLVEHKRQPILWRGGLRMWGLIARSPRLFRMMGRLIRWGSKVLPSHHKIPIGPLGGWTQSRDIPEIAAEPFHEWWAKREKGGRHE